MFELSDHKAINAMTRKLVIITFCLLIVSCKKNVNSNTSDLTNSNFTDKIDLVVNDYIVLDIFSGIVLVAQNGEILFHKAFGLADRNSNIKNSTNTLFDIGSMNKTFTSIVIKQLVQEGRLKIEDHLIDYIDGFNDPNIKKTTINHLLNHESGFGDYHSPYYFSLPTKERTLNSIIERAKEYQLLFEPGTENEYSNLGYVILGGIIEVVTGNSYFDEVQKRIIDPLKLQNTYLNDFNGLDNRMAKGYFYTPLGELEESAQIQDLPNPDGGFLSTTEDIMKFYRSYYYDDLLLSKEFKSNDPFFKYLNEIPEGKAIGAAGGFDGFNTALFQVVTSDLTIIVFANMDEPVAEHIAQDILDLSRGETPNKPQLPAIQNVRKAYIDQGVEYIKSNFESLTENYHPQDPKDFILNDLGYAFLYGANDPKKAVELFKLNTELFPNVANCWDSYGEGLSKIGKISEAIKAYEKALSIRPDLESAISALKELKK